jgi:micrococcal nuclease
MKINKNKKVKKKISIGVISVAIIIGTFSVIRISASRGISAVSQNIGAVVLETSVLMPTENHGTYKVANVADGDTIDVIVNNKKERVRLAGINAPEVIDFKQAPQCFGKEAAAKTAEMLLNRYVTLETSAPQDNPQTGTLYGYVILNDNTNFNQYMIGEGFARRNVNDKDKYSEGLKAAEESAKKLKKGLWSACPPAAKNAAPNADATQTREPQTASR